MRLKAPAGVGNPNIGGVEIKPGKGGVYDVPPDVGQVMLSHGFVDIDAAPVSPAPTSNRLRDAVVALLKRAGVAIADPREDILATALGDLEEEVSEHVSRTSTEREKAVRAELEGQIDEHKARADTAEKNLADATAKVAQLEADLAAAKQAGAGDKGGDQK